MEANGQLKIGIVQFHQTQALDNIDVQVGKLLYVDSSVQQVRDHFAEAKEDMSRLGRQQAMKSVHSEHGAKHDPIMGFHVALAETQPKCTTTERTCVLEDFRDIGAKAQGQLARLETFGRQCLSLAIKHEVGLGVRWLNIVFIIA